jgi:hypothetical protein
MSKVNFFAYYDQIFGNVNFLIKEYKISTKTKFPSKKFIHIKTEKTLEQFFQPPKYRKLSYNKKRDFTKLTSNLFESFGLI